MGEKDSAKLANRRNVTLCAAGFMLMLIEWPMFRISAVVVTSRFSPLAYLNSGGSDISFAISTGTFLFALHCLIYLTIKRLLSKASVKGGSWLKFCILLPLLCYAAFFLSYRNKGDSWFKPDFATVFFLIFATAALEFAVFVILLPFLWGKLARARAGQKDAPVSPGESGEDESQN